jgi:outer membrane protein, heavy metal efflux system
MSLLLLRLGSVLALSGLMGCAVPERRATWPEPRPLGAHIPAYRPALEPPRAESMPPAMKAPEGVLQLPQAQALALMQNPDLAAFAWEVRAGEARTLQAGLPPNPEVDIEVENVAGSGAFQGVDGAEVTVGLSQVIELAGKRRKRTHIAALERDLAAWDYETARLDVLTQVTQAFVDVLRVQERLAVDADLVRLAEQSYRIVTERVKAGKVSPLEATRARVALASSRIALQRAQRELTAAMERLTATWGGTPATFERVAGDLETLNPIPSAAALAQRIEQNPDIARWATAMAQRQATVALEEANRIPDPTLGAGVRYFNNVDEADAHALLLAVSVPLPVFDRNQGNILEARHQLARTEAERRAAAVRVQTALAETHAALSAAFGEAVTLRDEVLPGAQQAFDAAREGYRLGKFQFLEVLDAQRTLFEARGQYIEALSAYHQAVAALERLIGEPLSALAPLSSQK